MNLKEAQAIWEAEAKQRYQERLAWEATPEGAAEVATQRAHEARMAEADRKWAEEHPPEEEEVIGHCPMCDAENDPMGVLGELTHFRCGDCGAEWSEEL